MGKNPFEVLKETRESWEYFASDKVIYEAQFVNTHRMEGISWVDSYLKCDLWIEVVIYVRHELVLTLLIEYGGNLFTRDQLDGRADIWVSDQTMFVGISELVQISEQAQFRPLTSVVWLKRFNSYMRAGKDVLHSTPSSPLVRPGSGSIVQGEQDGSTFLFTQFRSSSFRNVLQGKRPRNVIKRIPEIGNNISDNESPLFRFEGGFDGDFNDLSKAIEGAARYGLFSNGVLWVETVCDAPFERIDVYVCPMSLETGAAEWMVDRIQMTHDGSQKDNAENTIGARDSRTHKGILRDCLRQGGEAGERITSTPPEEELTRTSPNH